MDGLNEAGKFYLGLDKLTENQVKAFKEHLDQYLVDIDFNLALFDAAMVARAAHEVFQDEEIKMFEKWHEAAMESYEGPF